MSEPGGGMSEEEAAEKAGRAVVERLWGRQVADWRRWLARSPHGVDLLLWWYREEEITALVGADRYAERLAELLSGAAPRDLAALGLGCTRRGDRPCRAPEICSQDEPEPPVDGAPHHRYGPTPGACGDFVDLVTPHGIQVDFTTGDRHRAVFLLRDNAALARLWVDGVPVAEGRMLDNGGYWHQDRFYVIQIEGPEDHPAQGLGDIGDWLYAIVSLAVYDAERGREYVFVPGPDEHWTEPELRVLDGVGYVYANRESREANTPDRTFPTDAPTATP
ncbi:hypothetical protein [Streptomyces sp. RerS4]|uniref:hypothetical protein n=1 Tax=Streptomyces sp. RerS4 TaxID=2942449 RepID=UPI00201BCEDF|nr:hypothetical protein [Streptomyces sp. RerS4]UQW99979.1 hypothetical protein M4D82_05080 [Streptomyces sp. RerS4]